MNKCLKFERLRNWWIWLIWKLEIDFMALNCMHESQNWTGAILLENKKEEILSKFLIRINKHFTFNFTSHWNLYPINSFVALLSSYNKVFKSSRYSSVMINNSGGNPLYHTEQVCLSLDRFLMSDWAFCCISMINWIIIHDFLWL